MTLEESILYSPGVYDENYPDIFTDNCGLNLNFPEGFEIKKSWRGDKRKAVLKILTWRGLSGGAIHFYGKIFIDGVQYISNDKYRDFCDINKDILDCSYHLELKRKITSEDILNHPNKWGTYRNGDLTKCFNTIDDLKKLASQIFKLRFVGDNWYFYIEDIHGKETKFDQ